MPERFLDPSNHPVRLDELLASAPIVLYRMRWTIDGLVPCWVSDNVMAVAGHGAAALLDGTPWGERVHPDDRGRLPAPGGLPAEDPPMLEYRVLRADGRYGWLRDHQRVQRDAEGRPLGVTGCWTEVTDLIDSRLALRESEARHRSVLESVKDVIFQSDAHGHWTYLNPAWRELTGFSTGESLGRSFLEYVHPDDRQMIQARFQPLVMREQECCRHEVRYLCKGGGYCWVEVFARLTLSADGTILGTSGTLRDVTSAKLAYGEILRQQRELELANERLRAADRYKDEFLSVISHELRNPMNVIVGFLRLLEDRVSGPLTPLQAQHLSRMHQGAERVRRLVDDLLDVAKLQTEALHMFPRPARYAAICEEAIAAIGPAVATKQLALAAPALPELSVEVDEMRILQVLMNLLSNAVKFTPEGGRIELSVRVEGECLVTRVRDSGPGIAASDVPKLFQKFQQLDTGLGRQAGGTGLGLAISRAIVEGHHGTIGLDSTPGVGSTFWFSLPLTPAPAGLAR